MNQDEAAEAFRELVVVVQALRTPGTGCPWDLEQTHQSLRPYLVEETYEVLDAIDRGGDAALRDELGDLLLQVLLHAQLAADRGAFAVVDVVRGLTAKMVRRHPHVFGGVPVSDAADVKRAWEEIKRAETSATPAEALARVPRALPALVRAQRLSEKAAAGGQDDGPPDAVIAAVQHQLAALAEAARTGAPAAEQRGRLDHVLGELLFSLCQLARRLGLSAEDSLRAAGGRFEERCRNADTG